MENNLNEEINYKNLTLNELKNKFLPFSFISEDDIENEVNLVNKKLELSSKIIKYNDDFLNYLVQDRISNYESMLRLDELVKKVNALNNRVLCQKEYELIESLYESLGHKLYQNVVDQMIYNISYINKIYDNTEILSYMQIDNIFYLKIADKLKSGNELENLDIMLSVLDNKHLSINKLVKTAVIKYYANNYSENLIDKLIEDVLKTYDGKVAIGEHVRSFVCEISRKKMIKSL